MLRGNRVGKIKHGLSESNIYGTWCNIKRRCLRESDKHFPRWGGRGIKLYKPWVNDFKAFYNYVSHLEHFGEEGYSLDRINNDDDYKPDNLRWATVKMQNRNKRCTHFWFYNGENMTLSEWSERVDIPRSVLKDRLFKLGWDFETAISTPVMTRRQWTNKKKNVDARLNAINRYHSSRQSS